MFPPPDAVAADIGFTFSRYGLDTKSAALGGGAATSASLLDFERCKGRNKNRSVQGKARKFSILNAKMSKNLDFAADFARFRTDFSNFAGMNERRLRLERRVSELERRGRICEEMIFHLQQESARAQLRREVSARRRRAAVAVLTAAAVMFYYVYLIVQAS